MGLKPYLVRLVPFVAMVIIETLDVGLSTLSKAAITTRPPLTFSLLCKFFVLGFIGITVMQNCVFIGINYSSSTLGSAINNLIPAFTFLLAVIFRTEKGPTIWSLLVQSPSLSSEDSLPSQSSLFNMLATESNWVLGGLFLAVACLCLALWNISQAAILKGNNPDAWKLSLDIELISVIYSAVFGSVVTYSVQTWCIYKKGPVFVPCSCQ
ncbi:hypothetical protein Vadar_031098 [Vaccinium darrowii]|uniref:Uncharacterized protein n=1 Tax=Vaccinium darrowii TaxID=229202 RepID=A0ACB7ZMR8_9ERIC|nr:hypothetical protein Vadar_031098 [Vaccinium darrowii]